MCSAVGRLAEFKIGLSTFIVSVHHSTWSKSHDFFWKFGKILRKERKSSCSCWAFKMKSSSYKPSTVRTPTFILCYQPVGLKESCTTSHLFCKALLNELSLTILKSATRDERSTRTFGLTSNPTRPIEFRADGLETLRV